MGAITLSSRLIVEGAMTGPLQPNTAVPVRTSSEWDFLGNVPVPLRAHVRDAVSERIASHRRQNGLQLRSLFPGGQGGVGPFERIRLIRELDCYPRMLLSADYGNAFNRQFHARYVETGHFSSCQPDDVPSVFAECGLVDPKGWIGAVAVAPFVLLIDRQRLNGLPVPRRWSDLADPVYRGQVVFGGWRRDAFGPWTHFNKFFLLAMLRQLGRAGLARLVDNVPQLLHTAQMPRVAGTNRSPGGIYVLPWFFADICPRRADIEIVWPQDGALAYPLWLTVQDAHRQRLEFLISYLYAGPLSRCLTENRYPALCRAGASALPDGARLSWLGWDYIRHRSTADDVRFACRLFLDALARRSAGDTPSCG
jgi:ABC-type Fe3+ transport system substrate-binding protein